MKPKAQTLSQKFGFMDPDLATPQHDAIMMWLDEYVTNEVAAMTYGTLPDYKWELTGASEWARENFPRLIRENKVAIASTTPCFALTEKVWEWPVLDKGFTIGFVDMCVSYAPCEIDWRPIGKAFDAFARESGGGSAAGFPFPYTIEQSQVLNYKQQRRFYEVKPSIPSLGEVIRQVRMYQTYTNRERYGEWWIVSPDTRFKEQLESQGIKFLAVPSSI